MQDILDTAPREPAPRELDMFSLIALNGLCAAGMTLALKSAGASWGGALLLAWVTSGVLAVALAAALIRILPVISARLPAIRPARARAHRRALMLEDWQDDLCRERMEASRRPARAGAEGSAA